jgi:hypothetical protein
MLGASKIPPATLPRPYQPCAERILPMHIPDLEVPLHPYGSAAPVVRLIRGHAQTLSGAKPRGWFERGTRKDTCQVLSYLREAPCPKQVTQTVGAGTPRRESGSERDPPRRTVPQRRQTARVDFASETNKGAGLLAMNPGPPKHTHTCVTQLVDDSDSAGDIPHLPLSYLRMNRS